MKLRTALATAAFAGLSIANALAVEVTYIFRSSQPSALVELRNREGQRIDTASSSTNVAFDTHYTDDPEDDPNAWDYQTITVTAAVIPEQYLGKPIYVKMGGHFSNLFNIAEYNNLVGEGSGPMEHLPLNVAPNYSYTYLDGYLQIARNLDIEGELITLGVNGNHPAFAIEHSLRSSGFPDGVYGGTDVPFITFLGRIGGDYTAYGMSAEPSFFWQWETVEHGVAMRLSSRGELYLPIGGLTLGNSFGDQVLLESNNGEFRVNNRPVAYSDSPQFGGTYSLVNTTKLQTGGGTATGANSVALGGATANTANSVAGGSGAIANGTNTIALGLNAYAGGTASLALGHGSSASGASTTAIGSSAFASHIYSVAVGRSVSAHNGVAMGYSAIAGVSGSTAYHGVAIGSSVTASGNNSVAVGNGSIATNIDASAFGRSSFARGRSSVALGFNADAYGPYQTVLGHYNVLQGSTSASTPVDSDLIFILGNGTATNSRSSALTIRKDAGTAIGTGVSSNAASQFVAGKYNNTATDNTTFPQSVRTEGVFVIGAGADNDNRVNAMRVLENGTILIKPQGDLSMGGFTDGQKP